MTENTEPIYMNVMNLRFESKEKNDFAQRFNTVGELYDIATEKDTQEAWDNYYSAKYCLEQGLPL